MKVLSSRSIALLLVLIVSACSGPPVKRRTPRGNRYGNRAIEFEPIKKKIALLEFHNESPAGGRDLGITATEEFRNEISRTRDFIIDPTAEAMFGSSKEIFSGGGVKLAKLARKAKLAGTNLVVFGRITEARVRQKSDEIGLVRKMVTFAQSKLEIRVFDVHSNKEIFSATLSGNVDDQSYRYFSDLKKDNKSYRQEILRYSVRVASRRFIPKFVEMGERLDWIGRVAKIIGSKIYINAGRKSGVNIGDILKVITEGQEIYDPETGALLGVSKGEVKGTLEVTDYFGPDGAVSILHSGGTVTEGDFVQLY